MEHGYPMAEGLQVRSGLRHPGRVHLRRQLEKLQCAASATSSTSTVCRCASSPGGTSGVPVGSMSTTRRRRRPSAARHETGQRRRGKPSLARHPRRSNRDAPDAGHAHERAAQLCRALRAGQGSQPPANDLDRAHSWRRSVRRRHARMSRTLNGSLGSGTSTCQPVATCVGCTIAWSSCHPPRRSPSSAVVSMRTPSIAGRRSRKPASGRATSTSSMPT